MSKHEIECPHKIPISQCPEHWAIFQELTDTQPIGSDDELETQLNRLLYASCDYEAGLNVDLDKTFDEVKTAINAYAARKAEQAVGEDEDTRDYGDEYQITDSVENSTRNDLRTEIRNNIRQAFGQTKEGK